MDLSSPLIILHSEPSRARPKRRRILNRPEGRPLRIHVGLYRPRHRVRHVDGGLDVGEAAGVDPELLIEAAGVEDLDDHLHVRGAEEPEVAGVRGQRYRLANAGVAVRGLPVDVHLETAAGETEARGTGNAVARLSDDLREIRRGLLGHARDLLLRGRARSSATGGEGRGFLDRLEGR